MNDTKLDTLSIAKRGQKHYDTKSAYVVKFIH